MPDLDSASLDLIVMTNHFSQSIVGDDVSLDPYCAGYKQIAKFVYTYLCF